MSWVAPLAAHDLAIDQLMLWPDRTTHQLRGEFTLDPQLTRPNDTAPSADAAQRVLRFLAANVRVSVDGRTLALQSEVRELWERGGATLGDLVVFSAALPESARELRVFAGGLPALVVSVQVPGERYRTETVSWLLGLDEWTPVYPLGGGWQHGDWQAGGPEAFASTPRAAQQTTGLAGRFLRLGVRHILPDGVDHLLFVAGLVLGSARRYRRVLVSLTLFTLAHTLTLGLSSVLTVHAPPCLVEPLIGLSICLLGLDNLRARRHGAGSDRGRHVLVFGFGLVHGLGFANALSNLSFDREHLLLTLFSFNLGVELGQVAVVLCIAFALYWLRDPHQLRRYATLPGSFAIATSGLFLVLERAGLFTGSSLLRQ